MKLSAERHPILEQYPISWPPKEFLAFQSDVTVEQLASLRKLIDEKSNERLIEKFLHKSPSILALILGLFNTGHHAAWVVPKQVIRMSIGKRAPGLIPDYLIAGANSDGVSWWVLELKGCDTRTFSNSKSSQCLSPSANRGIIQLIEYIDACAEAQSYLRDQLGLKGFREPRGILLIGTEDEYSEHRKRNLKAAWNRNVPKVQIRSYHALLREAETKFNHLNVGSKKE